MTEKLFYSDSHMTTFSACVKECEQKGDYYEVVLDRTAFFPTGGGQYADTGMLGDANVIDVREADDIVYHVVTKELKVKEAVTGRIDWEERFSKMQQHSGEHIVSGIVHKRFGYDNVGFHMGKDAITMDFNGVITPAELREIELEANKAVVQNLDIITLYPKKEDLENISYRSKIEIEGQVRIVEIPGYDRCACCAPHVKKTGEIGVIKLTNVQNYKGGVRVSMLCGFRALADYNEKATSVKQISMMLSAKEEDVANEVERLKEELAHRKLQFATLQKEILVRKVEQIEEIDECMILFEENIDGNLPRELMNLLLDRGCKIAVVFAKTEEEQYRYVVGSQTHDVRPISKVLNESFAGRGGGKPEMVQGSVCGAQDQIREEVIECSKKVLAN